MALLFLLQEGPVLFVSLVCLLKGLLPVVFALRPTVVCSLAKSDTLTLLSGPLFSVASSRSLERRGPSFSCGPRSAALSTVLCSAVCVGVGGAFLLTRLCLLNHIGKQILGGIQRSPAVQVLVGNQAPRAGACSLLPRTAFRCLSGGEALQGPWRRGGGGEDRSGPLVRCGSICDKGSKTLS